jgi:hypothetical protein
VLSLMYIGDAFFFFLFLVVCPRLFPWFHPSS